MSELVFAAEQIEDTMHYEMNAQQVEALNSSCAAQTRSVPMRACPNLIPRLHPVQGPWLREMEDSGLLARLK